MDEEGSGKRRERAGVPFIMPDGRPLGLFLTDNNLIQENNSKKGKKRPGLPKAARQGWSSNSVGTFARDATTSQPTDGYRSDIEQAEAQALARVGQRRRRRWLNDKLLRDMAGTLTARDMEALFKPVPFGETGHVSLFTKATSAEYIQVWDLFRSVDMDKETRVLKKWEQHVRELQQGPEAIENDALHALAAWSSVSSKARNAMKRANPAGVERIECQLLQLLVKERKNKEEMEIGGIDREVDEVVVVELEDGFGRLIAHGLAEFYGLVSFSRMDSDGVKRVVVKRRRGKVESRGPPVPPRITCSDILMLLEDGPEQGLSTHALEEAYCHTPNSASESAAEQLMQQTVVLPVQ